MESGRAYGALESGQFSWATTGEPPATADRGHPGTQGWPTDKFFVHPGCGGDFRGRNALSPGRDGIQHPGFQQGPDCAYSNHLA